MGDQKPVYLVLMGNTKNTSNKFIKNVYDLKGSMVSRKTDTTMKLKNTECLKDKNLLENKEKEFFLRFKE